ncbi:MAG: hypothetical protein DLM60_09020 [Pseudonocardiales bacterium]|nr:MAG: hypothetical protein DLM60_09020 [Pseudonocardiales bacterium]
MDKTALYARDISSLTCRRSTKSSPDGQERVEVTELGRGAVALRDSNNPTRPDLRFAASEWVTFVDGVRDGEFRPMSVRVQMMGNGSASRYPGVLHLPIGECGMQRLAQDAVRVTAAVLGGCPETWLAVTALVAVCACLSASSGSPTVNWYVRSMADRDTHRGELLPDGTVLVFRPRGAVRLPARLSAGRYVRSYARGAG